MTPESRAILQAANSGLPRGDFLGVVAAILSKSCNCDSVGLRMLQGGSIWRCRKAVRDGRDGRDTRKPRIHAPKPVMCTNASWTGPGRVLGPVILRAP